MGATTFWHYAKGKTPQDAFQKAREEAAYDYGHAGYTGTIAEKQSFVMIDLPKEMNPEEYADQLIQDEDRRIDDKWGPAGCFKLNKGEYMFFGWASS